MSFFLRSRRVAFVEFIAHVGPYLSLWVCWRMVCLELVAPNYKKKKETVCRTHDEQWAVAFYYFFFVNFHALTEDVREL